MKTTFKHPIDCYNSIREIEDDMELSIHDLVWKYGKRNGTKKSGVTYELSTYYNKRYALLRDNKGVLREIKKVIISNPEQCHRMGKLMMVDSCDKVYSFFDFRISNSTSIQSFMQILSRNSVKISVKNKQR